MPGVAEPTLTTPELLGVFGSELSTPLPDGLVGDGDAPLREEFFDIAEAEREPMVQPHAVTDDFTRESVAAVADLIRLHHRILSTPDSSGQYPCEELECSYVAKALVAKLAGSMGLVFAFAAPS